MSASDFLHRHGWQMRANHWEHPRIPDVLHSAEGALLQAGMWLEQERVSPEERAVLDASAAFPTAALKGEIVADWRQLSDISLRWAAAELARREGK